MPIAIPAAIIAGKLIAGFLKHKGQKKQNENARNAEIQRLTLNQKMGEDRRISRAGLGASILGGIGNHGTPGAAYGGRVNFNTNIDPGILAGLMKERTYDFSKAVGDPNAGGTYNAVGGAVGDAANALGSAYGTGAIGGGAGAGGLISGLMNRNAPVTAGAPPGTILSTGYNFDQLQPRRL